ncbi:MAG TPA: DUF1592 domain-containing protein [Polyangiaceae bacterium]|nr:DUF1592 domain-containing protein [Polyangiaceae bacterium]
MNFRQLGRSGIFGFLLAACDGTALRFGETGTDGGPQTASTTSGTSGESTSATSGSGGSTGMGGASIGAGGSLTADDGPAMPALVCVPNSGPDAGKSVALALTNIEYDRTVRDLLGEPSLVSRDFPSDLDDFWVRRNIGDPLSQSRIVAYRSAAVRLSQAALERGVRKLLPCDPATTGEDACADAFMSSFGARAFRRPMTADDLGLMRVSYENGRAQGSFDAGIVATIAYALVASDFLLTHKPGERGTLKPLAPYALASRIAYFVTRTTPDSELFAAAAQNKLATKDDIENQVRRLLSGPTAHEMVRDFFTEWLSLDAADNTDKDVELFPTFGSVRPFLKIETQKLVESIFFDGNWSDLFLRTGTFLNAPLAQHYGIAGIAGQDLQPASMGPNRMGILTQASLLSVDATPTQTKPTKRGWFVRGRFLGVVVPIESPALPVMSSSVPGETTRQATERVMMSGATCGQCHRLMDSIGFGFEHFDAIGQFRATENGKPIDASGTVADIDGKSRAFNGAIELSKALSSSPQVRATIARQWFRFALKRIEEDGDACSLAAATDALAQTGRMQDLVVAIATSDSFRYERW